MFRRGKATVAINTAIYISTYMKDLNDVPEGLGTLLRALLAKLDPVVEQAYAEAVPSMRVRYFPVMRALAHGGSATIGDLAQQAHVSQPAMTQTVAQMIRTGFLEPVSSADARHRKVMLSSKGCGAADTLIPEFNAVARAAQTLDNELTMLLSDLLREALAALSNRDFHARIEAEKVVLSC